MGRRGSVTMQTAGALGFGVGLALVRVAPVRLLLVARLRVKQGGAVDLPGRSTDVLLGWIGWTRWRPRVQTMV